MNSLRVGRILQGGPDEHRPPSAFWGPMRPPAGIDVERRPATTPSPDSCPVCGADRPRGFLTVYGWPIHECRRCRVGFVWPQPSDRLIGEFYGSDYWAGYLGSDEPLANRPAIRSNILERQADCLERIAGRDLGHRILDVGAGDGSMLRVLADRGYERLLGLDLDPAGCRRARERLGVEIRPTDLFEFDEGDWDVITLWAVIEHLKQPVAVVRRARELLRPGGLLLLMTGDNESAPALVQGTVDLWVYPPEHLFYFGRRSLVDLLAAGGFERPRCRLQFQARWKEALLWGRRVLAALEARIAPPPRAWRSRTSNLLVAWALR